MHPAAPTVNVNSPWYPTVNAFEVYDSMRTQRFREAEFLGSFGQPDQNLVRTRTADGFYPVPMNIVTGGKDELYIYGGAGSKPGSPGAYVARLSARSLKEVWRTRLFDHAANPDQWMYPGVIGIHANGHLYVIYDFWLAKLDRRTGKIIKKTTLPSGFCKPEDTSYNGFNLLDDGRIVAKSIYRSQDSHQQGFNALLDDLPNAPSVTVVVCPDSLSILGSAMADQTLGGRLAASRFKEKNFVYLTDQDCAFRYQVDEAGGVSLDKNWRVRYRRNPDTKTALGIAIINDFAVFSTNALASKAPMSVWAVSLESSSKTAVHDPFPRPRAHLSYSIAAIAADPENNLIYLADTGAGKIAAVELRLDGKGCPRLETAWEKKQRTTSYFALIGPPEERVLVSTDIPGPWPSERRMFTYTEERLVWRDAKNGRRLATSPNLGKMAGLPMCPGFDGTIFFLDMFGRLSEVKVVQRASEGGS